MKNKWEFIRIIIGIILGVVIAKIGAYFEVPSNIFTWILTIASIIILVGFSLFNVFYQKRLNKRLFASEDFLKEENGVEKFIKYNEEILYSLRVPTLRLKVIVFLVAGYGLKGDYETPRRLLKEINYYELSKRSKEILDITLAMVSFKAGYTDEAMKIMEDNRKRFSKYDGTYDKVGGILLYPQVLELINLGKVSEAVDKLEKARAVMGDDYYKNEYELILKSKAELEALEKEQIKTSQKDN